MTGEQCFQMWEKETMEYVEKFTAKLLRLNTHYKLAGIELDDAIGEVHCKLVQYAFHNFRSVEKDKRKLKRQWVRYIGVLVRRTLVNMRQASERAKRDWRLVVDTDRIVDYNRKGGAISVSDWEREEAISTYQRTRKHFDVRLFVASLPDDGRLKKVALLLMDGHNVESISQELGVGRARLYGCDLPRLRKAYTDFMFGKDDCLERMSNEN